MKSFLSRHWHRLILGAVVVAYAAWVYSEHRACDEAGGTLVRTVMEWKPVKCVREVK